MNDSRSNSTNSLYQTNEINSTPSLVTNSISPNSPSGFKQMMLTLYRTIKLLEVNPNIENSTNTNTNTNQSKETSISISPLDMTLDEAKKQFLKNLYQKATYWKYEQFL